MIAEDRNENRYYDHKLTAIKKDDLLPSVRPVTSEGSGSKSPFSVNYDKQLFDLLQDFQSAEAINSPSNRDFSVSPRREDEFVQSARETRERIAQQLKAAGADDETANAGGEIWANHLLARARALGTDEQGRLRPDALTPADLDKLNVRGEEDAEADWGGNVYDQAVRAGLDMDERVPVVDLSGVADRAKGMNWRGLLRHLKSQVGQEPSISRDALAFLKMPANTEKLHHIAYSGAQVPAKVKPLRNASVLSLPELMRNAVYVEEAPNTKTDKKPDVLKYHRFYVPVVSNGKVSTIRIVAEEKKTSDKLFPIDVDAYDVIVERKRAPSPKGDNAQLARRESSLREITIREMLRGVKGMDGEYYAQSSLPDAGTEEELNTIVEAAKASGTYLKAPNGNETNLTPEQWVLVRTERFKEWFGDWENDPENASKVLDGNGEPLVVYHGTDNAGFDEFDPQTTGTFFSDRKDVASSYADSRDLVSVVRNGGETEYSGGSIYPVFLNIKRPYIVDAHGQKWDCLGLCIEDNRTGKKIETDENGEKFSTEEAAYEYIKEYLDGDEDRYRLVLDGDETTTNAWTEAVFNGKYGAGYDGAIFKHVIDDGSSAIQRTPGYPSTSYAVFEPEQIKSVDNRGTFDDTGNIYNQSAWHGSPYRFDEFDLGEIGSGEGAQENAIRRGQIRIGSHGEGLVTLFKNADRSTFFHEIGHMMLDDLIADGLLEKANARTRADLETVKTYLGIGDMDLSKRHTFDGAEKARYAEAQERFARSFEAYLMEGKSPTAEMRSVFAKIKQWLIDIYRDIKRLGVELSPEVREVFDRLLTTPERGDFGPIFRGYEGEAAIEKLLEEKSGEVPGAVSTAELGPVDFVYGEIGSPEKKYTDGWGISHIAHKHGMDAAKRVPQILRDGVFSPQPNGRVYYESPEGRVVVKLEWKNKAKTWVLTSFLPENEKDSRFGSRLGIAEHAGESSSSPDGNLSAQTIPQTSNKDNRDFSVRSDLPQVTVTAPPESKSAGTLIRVKDIYDKLRAIAPVRKGVSAPAAVAGYYTPETGVARERHWGDFPTALHEIGHALDYKLGLRESVRDAETSRQLYDELCELGKATSPQNVTALYEKLHGRYMRASGAETHGPDVSAAALKFEEAQRYLMKEGIAEYFRGYAFNPDLMEVVAPEYTKLFREALETHVEYQQPVGELFDAVRSYSELTPEQKLRAGMLRGNEKVKNQKGWRASAAEAWDGFRQKFDDQLRYLEQMQNLLCDRARELAKEHSAFVGNYYCRFKNNGFTK